MAKIIEIKDGYKNSQIKVGDVIRYTTSTYAEHINDYNVVRKLKDYKSSDGSDLVQFIVDSRVVEIVESKSGKSVTINIESKGNKSGVSCFTSGLKTTSLFSNF